MYLFDNRMVEGQPLHYYYYNYPQPLFARERISSIMEDDLMIPPSPNSTQSDSDNSLSSIEVSPKPIRARSVIQHTPPSSKTNGNDVRCCWRSCGIAFDSLDQLANHVTKVHSSSGPGGLFYCGWEGCTRNNKGFNARYKMLVHVRTHTNEKPHQCYQCEKSFSRAENLKIHSRSHSGEKPYVCPVPGCKKAYSNSSDRFKHTRTHQVEKPYQCKVPGCPKRYTDPSSLRKHVKTYKHFVHNIENTTSKNINNENNNNNNNNGFISITSNVSGVEIEESKKIEMVEVEVEEMKISNDNLCDCAHSMCCSKNNNGSNNIFRLENLNEKCHQVAWNGFHRHTHQESIFVGYGKEMMDVDSPLDLSVNRKIH